MKRDPFWTEHPLQGMNPPIGDNAKLFGVYYTSSNTETNVGFVFLSSEKVQIEGLIARSNLTLLNVTVFSNFQIFLRKIFLKL